MPWAVSGWFESRGEAWVREGWTRLAEAGVSTVLHDGPYRPHVTFGVWQSLAPGAADAIARIADDEAPLDLRCEALGVFMEPERVVFLAAVQTRRLYRMHDRIHAAVAGVASSPVPHYQPGRWIPHCTLARDVERKDIAAAVAIAADAFTLPLALRIDRLGLVETPAEVETADFPLAG